MPYESVDARSKKVKAAEKGEKVKEWKDSDFVADRRVLDGRMPELAVSGLPEDLQFRWVLDYPENRVGSMIERGWAFWMRKRTESGTRVTQDKSNESLYRKFAKGYSKANEPLYLYLMCKPKKWFDEDQKAKQAAVDDIENQIVTNKFKRQPGDGLTQANNGARTLIQHGQGPQRTASDLEGDDS